MKNSSHKNSLLVSTIAFGLAATAANALTIQEAGGWFETAYAKWTPVSGATKYNVYCDGVKIDDALIRTYSGYVRADIPGISAGSHTIKVAAVTASGESSSEVTTKTITAIAHDRSGFAFSDGRVPGAYKADGTLKNGAVIIYMSEATKETVTMDVTTNSKGTKTTCKSVQGILNCYKKGYETRPLDIRLIGNVTDSDSLVGGDMMIDLGNSTNSYVTVEGIGEDATVNGWGIRIKNAQNVEVRNVGIMNVNSGEGDNIGLQQGNAHIWVHNNDFFYGDAGSDADQAKGDGALDCKKSSYVTFSYNHFWDNGKSNLLGLSEGVYSYNSTDYYITYHHNWYDHSDSRHPRVRFYNAHVYNNYYDGNAKYGAGSTQGSSVFMEGNYFRYCKYPMLTSMQGSDLYAGTATSSTENATFSKEPGGSIKAFNNFMEGGYTFIPYGATSYVNKGESVSAATMNVNTQTDFDAYVVKSAKETVPNSVKSKSGAHYSSNFATSSKMYSYKEEEPAAAKTTVTTYAGRMHGGDFQWTFTAADDESYAVNTALKNKLNNYTSALKSIKGTGAIIITSSSSEAEKSSSSQAKSSSSMSSSSCSEKVSSSSVAASVKPIFESVSHNFTESGNSSEYFAISGNLTKASTTVNGKELTQALKMESATSIQFTLEKAATVTLTFNADFAKKVKVNGKAYTANAGIVKVNLDAGDYTITKGDMANLFVIDVEIGNVSSSSSVADLSSSSTENKSSSSLTTAITTVKQNTATMRFSRATNHLSIECARVKNVAILSANGQVLLRADGQKELNLSNLPRGMYIIRAVTENGTQLMKIQK